MVGTGILPNNTRCSSPECYRTFWMMTIDSDTLHWSGITPVFDTITDPDLITEFDFYLIARGFHRTFATGAACQQRDAYSSGHLVLSHFGTCKCSNVETNLSWTCLFSGLLSFEHPSVLFFLFVAIQILVNNKIARLTRIDGQELEDAEGI